MGLFGGKKKDVGKQPVPVEGPTSTRRSVRRVVPAKPGAKPGARPAAQPPSSKIGPAARPIQPSQDEVAVDDVQLPVSVVDAEQLDLGAPPAAEVTPARPPSTRPILASAAPEFSGDLGAARNGPARTGDEVLVEFLTGKAGLLTADQAGAARNKAANENLPLDEAAVNMGMLTEEQLVNALSQETWVPHLKVDKYEIRKKALDTITRDDAVHYGVFPVDKLGSLLTLAMVNPLDVETIRSLEQKTGLDIKKVVAARGEINQAIDKYYGGKVVASDGSRSFTQETTEHPRSPTQMLRSAEQASVDNLPEIAPEPVFDAPSAFDATATPVQAAAINIQPEISNEIQDIDDLLGGEETIAPAIIEPVSIKPEESSDALDLTDAPIAPGHAGDLDFGEMPKPDTGALSKPTLATDRSPTEELELPAAVTAAPKAPRQARVGELPSATARIAAGSISGSKLVNLVPVMEDEFRYAISHGKAKVFERWIALQSRNRIVNAVSVEKELDPVLSRLYAQVRKAS